MAWTYSGRIIRYGKAWTDVNGNQYPSNWMGLTSDAEKKAVGLLWQDDPAAYDRRFWWDATTPKALDDRNEVDSDGKPIIDTDTGKQLVTLGLKSRWKTNTKKTAAGLLAPTDWYVTRKAETDAAIPSDVTTYRAAVRTKSGTIEAAIDGAADHAAFIALFTTPVDSDGNPTGKAPISDWPDPLT